MGKLNIANINTGLNKVKSITEALANVSHFENVPAELIHQAVNNPYAANDTDENLHDLAMSIQANGLINPLAVNKVSDASYSLISGERRYSAITKYLDMKTIPCMVYENISQNAAQLKLHIANLDVRDYTTAQKLQFYQDTDRLLHDMKESGEYTGAIQQGIAELLGVSDRQVRKYKTITDNLSAEQQQQVIDGELSINDACKIAQQSEEIKNGTGSAFDNTEPQQPSYSEPAEMESGEETGTGYETDIPDAHQLQKDTESGTSSGFCDEDYDHEFWDDKIKFALKEHYDCKEVYLFYLFQVPTTQDAIKDILKPRYSGGGGTIIFPASERGFGTYDIAKMQIEYNIPNDANHKHKRIILTYSQVDSFIREMIRSSEWISKADERSALEEHMKKRKL